jgi:endonuclease YncB( thermonuclease family)
MGVRTAPAYPTRVIDGDTFVGDLKVWDSPRLELVGVRFRLDGLNCPETKDKETKQPNPAGLAALAFTARWLVDENGDWREVSVASRGLDEYGRTLAVVTAKGQPTSLNSALLEAGHATVMRMMVRDEDGPAS